jgi:hypothetical protein
VVRLEARQPNRVRLSGVEREEFDSSDSSSNLATSHRPGFALLVCLFSRFKSLVSESELFPSPSFAVPPSSFSVPFAGLELLTMIVVVRECVEDIAHGDGVFASDDVRVLIVVHNATLDIEDRDSRALDTWGTRPDVLVADD